MAEAAACVFAATELCGSRCSIAAKERWRFVRPVALQLLFELLEAARGHRRAVQPLRALTFDPAIVYKKSESKSSPIPQQRAPGFIFKFSPPASIHLEAFTSSTLDTSSPLQLLIPLKTS